jgi:hypothetical protein
MTEELVRKILKFEPIISFIEIKITILNCKDFPICTLSITESGLTTIICPNLKKFGHVIFKFGQIIVKDYL